MLIPKEPINLSTKVAEYNYEEEIYIQNDPPLYAYRTCKTYIPVNLFCENEVKNSIYTMLSKYNIDLNGINIHEAIRNFTFKLEISNSWRKLILEGVYGFLELGMSPDTVKHPDVRPGYVLVYFMYLPKRGEIYDDIFENIIFESPSLPKDLCNGMLIGFRYPYIHLPNPVQGTGRSITIPRSGVHYAVVISQKFIKDNQSIPITKSNIKSTSTIITGKQLVKLTHSSPTDTSLIIKNTDFQLQTIHGGRKWTDNDPEASSSLSMHHGQLEVISIYNPSILRSSVYRGFEVGILTDDALADVQKSYNNNRANLTRILIDKKGNLFQYNASDGKFYDACGNELINPENNIDAPPQEFESINKMQEDSYDPSHHSEDYITLLLIN